MYTLHIRIYTLYIYTLHTHIVGISIFHGACGVLGVAGAAVNAHHILRPEEQGQYVDMALRAYSASFCLVMIVCEIDWRFMMRRFRILDIWLCRGFFYLYAGLQTLENFDFSEKAFQSSATLNNLVGLLICCRWVIDDMCMYVCVCAGGLSMCLEEAISLRG